LTEHNTRIIIFTLQLNAGVQPSTSSLQFSEDGWETTYQANHLSHFLLTHLLLPSLLTSKARGGARVVVVASELHTELGLGGIEPSPGHFHALTSERKAVTSSHSEAQKFLKGKEEALTPLQIYSLTKLYNLWFTYKLSAMCKEMGLPITVDAVTPGFVPSSNLAKAGLSLWVQQNTSEAVVHVCSLMQ
jgi:NAD(P)-dependent dehydrogenase (short-subunit alcohol dehydrogenase family)